MSGEQGGKDGSDGQQPPPEIVEFINQLARQRAEAGVEATNDAGTTQEPNTPSHDENASPGTQPDTSQQTAETPAPSSFLDAHTRNDRATEEQPSVSERNTNDPADHPASGPDAPEQPAGTNDESQPVEVTTEEVEATVQNGLREWVHNVLMTDRRRLQPHHYRRTARLATIMGGLAHLRDALIALDDSDWNLGNTIQQYHFDNAARQQAVQSPPIDAPDSNRGLDRSAASGGPHWKANKHKLTLIVKMGKRMRRRNFEDVHEMTNDNEVGDTATSSKKAFNIDSPTPRDLLRLNKWRNSEIIKKAGLPRRPRSHTLGDWWHPAAKRDVMRRFIKNVKGGKQPNYRGIAKQHSKLFEGVFLPREIHEVPVRNDQQIAALCERAWKKIGGKGRGKKKSKRLESITKVFEKSLNEEKARAKKSIKQDFSATEEEVKEVEDEEQPLQDDTASEAEESDGSEQDPLDSDDPQQPEEQEEGEEGEEGGEEESSGEVSDVPYAGDAQWDEETDSEYYD